MNVKKILDGKMVQWSNVCIYQTVPSPCRAVAAVAKSRGVDLLIEAIPINVERQPVPGLPTPYNFQTGVLTVLHIFLCRDKGILVHI